MTQPREAFSRAGAVSGFDRLSNRRAVAPPVDHLALICKILKPANVLLNGLCKHPHVYLTDFEASAAGSGGVRFAHDSRPASMLAGLDAAPGAGPREWVVSRST